MAILSSTYTNLDAVKSEPLIDSARDTMKNYICLKFAPVKTRKLKVTVNIKEVFKFLFP